MKTKCYCVYCPKHPFFERQKEFGQISGWHANMYSPIHFDMTAGADVECLDPKSDAFYELEVDPDYYEFKTCAYGMVVPKQALRDVVGKLMPIVAMKNIRN